MSDISNTAQQAFELVNNLYAEYEKRQSIWAKSKDGLDAAVAWAKEKEREYTWSLDNKTPTEIQGFRDALNSAYTTITNASNNLDLAKKNRDDAYKAYLDSKEMLTIQEKAALEATLTATAAEIKAKADAAAAAAIAAGAEAKGKSDKTAAQTAEEIKNKKMWNTIYWIGGSVIGAGLLTWLGIALYRNFK